MLLAVAACAVSFTTAHEGVIALAQSAQVPILNWAIGPIGGLAVDRQDHLFVVQRPGIAASPTSASSGADDKPPKADCCIPAPPVLEFDQSGALVNSWGGPGQGYDWPQSEHGVFVDHKDVVWLAGNGGQGPSDPDLYQGQGSSCGSLARPGMSKGSADTTNMRGPANLVVDPSEQRGLRGRRVRQPSRDRPRWRDVCVQADVGRLREPPGRCRSGSVQSRCAACAAVPPAAQHLHLAGWLRLRGRPAEQPHSGVPKGRDVRQGSVHLAAHAARPAPRPALRCLPTRSSGSST